MKFPKEYNYIASAGLIFFGFFALKFQEYQHPIYGRIYLGAYHVYIGIACIAAGVFFINQTRNRNK